MPSLFFNRLTETVRVLSSTKFPCPSHSFSKNCPLLIIISGFLKKISNSCASNGVSFNSCPSLNISALSKSALISPLAKIFRRLYPCGSVDKSAADIFDTSGITCTVSPVSYTHLDKAALSVVILPQDTTDDTTVVWTSSDTNIAAVDQNGNCNRSF